MYEAVSWKKVALALALVNGLLAQGRLHPPVRTVPHPTAELPEMVTDRPDYTESTGVVGKHVIQVENGFTLERDREGTNLSGPELLMRIGLSKRLEFRIGGDGFLSQRTPGVATVSGYSDVEVGAKLLVFDQGRHRPALSLIPILSVPLGSTDFSSGAYDPTLKLALGKDLPRGFSLGGNLNFSSLSTPAGRFLQTAYSASLGHNLGAGFRGYWEIFGFMPWEKTGPAAWIADTGLTRSIGKNAQVDVRVGKSLTNSGPDWFWGFGVAFRRPARALYRGLRSTN